MSALKLRWTKAEHIFALLSLFIAYSSPAGATFYTNIRKVQVRGKIRGCLPCSETHVCPQQWRTSACMGLHLQAPTVHLLLQ